jgi:DNA-binding response OmpR family regulator
MRRGRQPPPQRRLHGFFTVRSRLCNHLHVPRLGRCFVVAAYPESTEVLYAGELEIRLGEGLVLATGRALTLSVREFELLAAMARRQGAIITREEVYHTVWGGELRPGDRSVDVYVSKLRGKLELALPDRRFIHTHQGFGYRFQPEPSRESATAAAEGVQGASGGLGSDPGRLSQDVHIVVSDA